MNDERTTMEAEERIQQSSDEWYIQQDPQVPSQTIGATVAECDADHMKGFQNLSAFVASGDFWVETQRMGAHMKNVDQLDKPVDPRELLSVFDDCGDACQSLHQAVETFKQDGECELSVINPPNEKHGSIQDALGGFMSNDEKFWSDVLVMESEAQAHIKNSNKKRQHGFDLSTTQGTAPSEELLSDLLGVFDEFSEEISALSEQFARPVIDTTMPAPGAVTHGAVASEAFSPTSVKQSLSSDSRATPTAHKTESVVSYSTHKENVSPEISGGDASQSIPDTSVRSASSEGVPDITIPTELSSGESTAVATAPTEEVPLVDHSVAATAKIRAGDLWDDVNVILWRPTKELLIDRTASKDCDDSPDVVALKQLNSELEMRAKRQPNVLLLGTMLISGVIAVAGSIYLLVGQHTASASPSFFPRMQTVLWVAAYVVNLVALSIPGRLDRIYHEDRLVRPWQSLFDPAPWAFAIWAPIYLLGLIVTVLAVYIGTLQECAALSHEFLRMLPYWVAGNWLQAIWCCVFRPEYSTKLWIPTVALILSSVCLCEAHSVLVNAAATDAVNPVVSGSIPTWPSFVCMLLTRSALSIHATWLVVSALMNGNSWVVVTYGLRARSLQTTAAFASAFLVAFAGIALTVTSQDPCFSLTAAWALDALSDRAAQKALPAKGTEISLASSVKSISADVHESLAGVEALLSGALKCIAVGVILSPAVQYFPHLQ